MVSDDTEHAAMVARALCESGRYPPQYARSLARQLRGWILLMPAGVGMATARACFRLLVGISPERSGVFSAGNGAAMRAAVLGVAWGHAPDKLRELVRASSRITHTDPKAEWGALVVAAAAYVSAIWTVSESETAHLSLEEFLAELPAEATELRDLVRKAQKSAAACETTSKFAQSIGVGEKGVSGYIYQTVPVALHAACRYPNDLRAALEAAISCGGDTDTVAAITGGIVGAGLNRSAFPPDLVNGLWEFPQTVAWVDRLADATARSVQTHTLQTAPPVYPLVRLARNVFFFIIVLLHGFRRLLPPY